jgi:hypothetical protein
MRHAIAEGVADYKRSAAAVMLDDGGDVGRVGMVIDAGHRTAACL